MDVGPDFCKYPVASVLVPSTSLRIAISVLPSSYPEWKGAYLFMAWKEEHVGVASLNYISTCNLDGLLTNTCP